jgi:uncharacterized membrane protein
MNGYRWIDIKIGLVLCALLSGCRHETMPPPTVGYYFPKVKAIVEQNCTVSCHAPSAGFPQGMPVVLETSDDIVAGAQRIKASVADPITLTNHRMPPDDTLSQADIDIIIAWAGLGGTSTIAAPQ